MYISPHFYIDTSKDEFVCLSLCPASMLTFLCALTSDLTYSLILTSGRFLHAFELKLPFVMSALVILSLIHI